MPNRIDRTRLESVFPSGDPVVLDGAALDAVLHLPTRQFLHEVGLPADSWLRVDPDYKQGEPQIGFSGTAARHPELTFDFASWMYFGEIVHDSIAVDVVTGKVYSEPGGDPPYLLNSSVEEFVNFLCLLEIERPNYDWEAFDSEDEEEQAAIEEAGYHPGADKRLRVQMTAADPVAFETPDSTWNTVLETVAMP
ncbi:SUKH-4 family immunity protein [Peterkaempfera sp. SMS 1(5)a]|uniref:SUKH-4 family immunity protein n=1 Tax=Peterkaempfera podocarpi TaxID=3232308 RepID=UPI0036727CEC